MSNHVTLEQFQEMSPEAVAALPTSQLYELQEAIRERVAKAKALNDKLKTALIDMHGANADAERSGKGKSGGIVHFAAPDDADFVITGDKKFEVEWDQGELWKIVDRIQKEWQGEPGEYITTKLSVSETKYKAWPSPIKKEFEAARTTKPGAVSIKIEKKKEG